jgi:LIM domain
VRQKKRKRGVLTEQRRFAVAFLELLTEIEALFAGGHISCTRCAERVEHEYVLAAGYLYHPRCLHCSVCTRTLSEYYYAVGDRILCKEHSDVHGKLTCTACEQVIEGEYRSALSLYFHPEHLCCAHCGAALTEQYVEREGAFYCGLEHARHSCEKNTQ